MSSYKKISLKPFIALSELLAEDVEAHKKLCEDCPELMDFYVETIETELKNEKISDYLTEEEKERQIEQIWEKIRKFEEEA